MGGVYFDYVSEGPDGFSFGISPDSPDQVMAQRLSRKFEDGVPFRMVVTAIKDLS